MIIGKSEYPHCCITYFGNGLPSHGLFVTIQNNSNVDANQNIYNLALRMANNDHNNEVVPVVRISGYHLSVSIYHIKQCVSYHLENNNGEGMNLLVKEDRKKAFQMIQYLRSLLQYKNEY